jgi:hypothetical protein
MAKHQNIIDATIEAIKLGKDAAEVMDCCKSLLKPDLFQLVANLAALVQSFPKEKTTLKVDVENLGITAESPKEGDNVMPKSLGEDEGASWIKVMKKKKRVCRSTYKGVECDMVSCDFDHPTICTACTAGKERRDPECKLWHIAPAKPKSKSKSTASKSTASKSSALGKGSRGKVPFSSSNPKGNHNNDYSGLKRKLAVSETQCLRAELALIKAQRSNPAPLRQKYSSVVSPLTRLPAPTQAVSTPASSSPDVVQILAQMAQQSQQMSQQFAALAGRLQA